MLLVLLHVKVDDCKIDVAAFLINDWLAVNVDAPVPPLEIDIVPDDTLEAFKAVKAEPEPKKLEADKVLLVLFHVKFGDCKIDVAAFPINIWFAVNVFVPIPHLEIDKVSNDTLEAFN